MKRISHRRNTITLGKVEYRFIKILSGLTSDRVLFFPSGNMTFTETESPCVINPLTIQKLRGGTKIMKRVFTKIGIVGLTCCMLAAGTTFGGELDPVETSLSFESFMVVPGMTSRLGAYGEDVQTL